ncbi:MAG: hypothetical protein EXR70_07455 [Deltaproteobacteria bacterium]|nr:hypothetical protein [Deltaproteobacteria bacterium]
MNGNPVWRESIEVYFAEGHGFQVYFYLLAILAPVEFFALYVPSMDAQMWSGSASLFKVCTVTALMLMVYFSLRVANQEFAPWRFQRLSHWLHQQGQTAAAVSRARFGFLLAHIGLSLLVAAPLLVWAGAIARTPLATIAAVFLLLPFYSLSYGVWGLVALALWERKPENRQVFIRCFFAALVILSALLYLPLNPIAFLLASQSSLELSSLARFGWPWPAAWIHLIFHLGLGAAGYVLQRWALRRES